MKAQKKLEEIQRHVKKGLISNIYRNVYDIIVGVPKRLIGTTQFNCIFNLR